MKRAQSSVSIHFYVSTFHRHMTVDLRGLCVNCTYMYMYVQKFLVGLKIRDARKVAPHGNYSLYSKCLLKHKVKLLFSKYMYMYIIRE